MKEVKIYSAVDADECKKNIGEWGYFGNGVWEIKQKKCKSILTKIDDETAVYRYRTETGCYSLYQPITAEYRKIQTIEEAETFFGKKIRSRDGKHSFIVDEATFGTCVLVNLINPKVLLDGYIVAETGEPVGIKE